MKRSLFLIRLLAVLTVNALLAVGIAAILGFNPLITFLVVCVVNELLGFVPLRGRLVVVTNFTSILHTEGSPNMGGLQSRALYCLHQEVDVHAAPTPYADATTVASLATVTTDHTFLSGKGWKHFYSTEDASFQENTAQGEIDGMSFHQKLTLYHPLMGATFMGWLSAMINRGVYFVAKDIEGLKRMVGSKGRPGRIKVVTGTTGGVAADRKGSAFEVHSDSNYPAPIVTAALVIESDDVDSGSTTF